MSSGWQDRLLWLGAGILVAFGFLQLLPAKPPSAGSRLDSPATAPASEMTVPATDLDATPEQALAIGEIRHLGVVLSSEAVDVAAEIEGRVKEMHVRAGDRVERSQLIAALDTRDLNQALRIGQADLTSAEAKLRQIALEVERSKKERQRRLALEGLVSKEEAESSVFQLADAEARLEVARAERDQVRARIERLQSNLERSEIRAPFAGEVALRYVDSGAVVNPGAPVARLISSSGLLVRFAVPPAAAARLETGTLVHVEIETLGLDIDGAISQISPEIDSASHMVFIEAHLASVAGRIPAGSVARVRYESARRKSGT